MAEPAKDTKKPEDLSGRNSILGKIDAGMRAAANFVTFGYADKIDALLSSGTYQENMAKNQAINEFDHEHNLAAVRTGQLGITAVAAVPGLVKAGVVGVVDVGAGLLAKVTGRKAAATVVAETAEAASVATTAATTTAATATAEVGAAAARTAGSAAKGTLKKAADAVGSAVRHPVKTAGKAAIGIAKTGATMAVPMAVIDHVIDSSMASSVPKVAATPDEAAQIDSANVESGGRMVASGMATLAATPGIKAAGTVLTEGATLAGLKFAGTKFGEAVIERMGGRFRPAIRIAEGVWEKRPGFVKEGGAWLTHTGGDLARHVGELAQSGITTMARGLGFAYVGGEVAASAYEKVDNAQDLPAAGRLAVQAADGVRDAYTKVKTAGLDASTDGSVSGVLITGATMMVSEYAEAMVPGISNIVSKEEAMLRAEGADFGDPRLRRMASLHMSSEMAGIKRDFATQQSLLQVRLQADMKGMDVPADPQAWQVMAASMSEAELHAHPMYKFDIAMLELQQAQRSKLEAYDRRWAPVNEKIDAFLASDKADFNDPSVVALVQTRLDQDKSAVNRRYEMVAFDPAKLDYQHGGFEVDTAEADAQRLKETLAYQDKWSPVLARVAAASGEQVSPVAQAADPAIQKASLTTEAAVPEKPKAAHAGGHPAKPRPAAHSPARQFNVQAAAEAPTVSEIKGGLAPVERAVMPLVAEVAPASPVLAEPRIDTSALDTLKGTGQDQRPTMALNTRGPSLPGSNLA